MAAQIREALTILRRKQVESRTGLSRSAIYAGMADGTFPTAIQIGPRAVGWVESEINDWVAAQIERSRKVA